MSVSKSSLSSDLKTAFETQLNKSSGDVKVPHITDALAADLGQAYHDYCSPATIGAAKLATKGTPSSVASALTGDQYLDGWEDAAKAWWGSATADDGSGAYIAGAAADTSGLSGLKAAVRALLPDPAGDLPSAPSQQLQDFCDSLAAALDKFTTKVKFPTMDDLTKSNGGTPPTSPEPSVS